MLTYNVLYKSKNNQRSINLIKKANPDLICLREVTPRFLKQFRAVLGKRYSSIRVFPRRGTWGAGIISKYPLSNVRHFPLRPHRIPGVQASLSWNGKKLQVVCVHLFPPVGRQRKSGGFFKMLDKNQKLRVKQARYLVKRFKSARGPVLLIGDMNEGRKAPAVKVFYRNGYTHACSVTGSACGGTYPATLAGLPGLFEIDHILGREVRFYKSYVIRKGGSDHYPVYSEVGFR